MISDFSPSREWPIRSPRKNMRIASFMILLFVTGCSKKPISTKATISDSVVETGHEIVITVEAKNRSFKKALVVPAYHALQSGGYSMNDVDFSFKPNGGKSPPITKHTPMYIDPNWEKLEARESRTYNFYWRSGKSDFGEGTLFLTFPHDFEPVEPFPVRIIKSRESDPRD